MLTAAVVSSPEIYQKLNRQKSVGVFSKDQNMGEENGKNKKYFCPHGERSNLVVLCKKKCEETGCRSTDLTYEKDAYIVTEYWCTESCLWWQKNKHIYEKK